MAKGKRNTYDKRLVGYAPRSEWMVPDWIEDKWKETFAENRQFAVMKSPRSRTPGFKALARLVAANAADDPRLWSGYAIKIVGSYRGQ